MRGRIKTLLGFLAVAFALCVCIWLVFVTFNDLPPREAGVIARKHAESHGYDVSGSGTGGEFVSEPDSFGGCEVEVVFALPPGDERGREVRVRMRRSSALADWGLTNIAAWKPPEK
jgi:hypothetical protein